MKATYIKTQPKCIINISKIVTVHDYEFDKTFTFEGEMHDFWELVYIDRGQVRIQRNEEEITLGQGEIIFHAPNEFHSIRAQDSSPNFFVLSFVSTSPAMQYFEAYHTVLDSTLKSFLSSILKEAARTYEISKNNPHLKKLTKRPNAPVGGEQLIKTYLEQLLIFLIRRITKEQEHDVFPTKETMENHLVTAIREMIRSHAEEPLRISDVCNSLGYSKSYLSRLFKEQTGETIASYATREKIKRAKLMIRENDWNFTQISDRLAFDNPQYFSRVFKRVTGMTPTEFKQSLNYHNLAQE